MNDQYEPPEAPPVPPEEQNSLGLPALALVNAILALYLLFIAVTPLFWGQFIGKIEVHTVDLESLHTITDASAERRRPTESKETDESLATFEKYRSVHVVVLIVAVAVAVALGRSAFLAVFYADVPIILTSTAALLAAILLGVNLALGWGGLLSVLAILVGFVEGVILYVPKVQRYLAGVPLSDEEDEDE